ncbi:uncharacterized protein LY89DRAFT_493955 [Mollisia scopiformis]|uniref:Ubiquitin-like domain-containing protein n=1 Tax=Mollisia scopiformis TaxID=149040 RepID=A0A194XHB2_MOLSC|nr:uncharacterized protein LY89DRAFT_493955 [Mollisia scopiformis]KUJ19553.1 hypothetical protein LY89DRAFT_493955 [Mollisia scopiformis]
MTLSFPKNSPRQMYSSLNIIHLIKFINSIWRRVETLDDPTILSTLETRLQHLSENLEYLRRESELLLKDGERRREVGVLIGGLSVDLNVLDIMVGKMKKGIVDEGSFEGLLERLECRLEDMREVLESVKKAQNMGLNWAIHEMKNSWHHHVHWSDLVEVRYPKDEFYQMERGKEKDGAKLDLRKDDGFDDDCITVFVRFQDSGFATKLQGSEIEVLAPKGTTLGDLKKALREKIGVPICQQLLSHRGSMLDNDFTFQDCGLENESTLNGVIISKHLAEGSPKTSWFWANGS